MRYRVWETPKIDCFVPVVHFLPESLHNTTSVFAVNVNYNWKNMLRQLFFYPPLRRSKHKFFYNFTIKV